MTVEVSGVTIRYGEHVAVRDVTARFPAGAVGLLGRNGAGKSSLLKALLGLVRPQQGTLTVLGMPADRDPAAVRAKVGYMPERDCYVAGLNGYETVRMLAQMSGLNAREASRRAHEVLYLVDLGEQRYRKVATYSTGMRQKVKLAAALVHDPAVLFLDEPTNGLDPDGRREMLAVITSLAEELGKSVLLSSHILQDVERVCREVVVLERGHVVAAGEVAELTRHTVRQVEIEVAPADVGMLDPRPQAAALSDAPGVLGIEWLDVEHGALAVTMDPDAELRALFAAVQGAGGSVRRIIERRRTLEEVFLGAVDDHGAGEREAAGEHRAGGRAVGEAAEEAQR